ncbi:MAG: aminoacyl-tRNA hydrolase [Aeoliella sp.]
MKLIVGLGNPGKKYEQTRHNVGFEVLAEVARLWQADAYREKHHGLLAAAEYAEEKVLLLCPQTFMNLSGVSVRSAVDFYKLPIVDLLVVCDDFNLVLGKLRTRTEGSAGGQNGLANIIQQLGTQDFARLRVGIGPVPERWDAADFVLGKWSRVERKEINEMVLRAAKAIECWVAEGAGSTMNQFN